MPAEEKREDRWFAPEPTTHLYYSPAYATLTTRQQQAYNRLHACSICEIISFLEESLPAYYLKAVAKFGIAPGLRDDVRDWAAAEKRHSQMFHQLLSRLAPRLYTPFQYRFVRVSPGVVRAVQAIVNRPALFPMLFWLGLIAEERVSSYGEEIIQLADRIDPEMVDAHRRHLRDEADHLRVDEALLALYWNDCPGWMRRVNARIFRWMLAEFLCAPKRAAIRLVDLWIEECPELAPRKSELVEATRRVGRDRRYHENLYSRRTVPRSFALFDRYVEFRDLGKSLWAYSPEVPE